MNRLFALAQLGIFLLIYFAVRALKPEPGICHLPPTPVMIPTIPVSQSEIICFDGKDAVQLRDNVVNMERWIATAEKDCRR